MKKQPLKEMLKKIGGEHLLNEARKYKLGDQWRKDFDYEGMLEMGVKAKYPKMSGDKLEKLFSLIAQQDPCYALIEEIGEISGYTKLVLFCNCSS